MPNFHTHWIVALQATGAAPEYVIDGQRRYEQAARGFSDWLWAYVHNVGEGVSKGEMRTAVLEASRDFEKELRTSRDLPGTWDDVACFSAFMLGACGPDFWTLPSESPLGQIPEFAGKHFDLGHYNRTHRQFQVSVSRLAGKDDLQARLEKSYFLGMATHVAGDLVIHELVNVYAGAYNLLEKKWENEQGYLTKNIWSTHNKVEHYWDTYVRYRFLGDYGEVFGGDGRSPGAAGTSWVAPRELPTIESLTRWVRANRNGKAADRLLGALGKDDVKYAVEKPLMFPWVACDRICAQGDLEPFVYSVVVDKKAGAYPEKEVFALAKAEAESYQMQDGRAAGGYSERDKLAFFTSGRNQGTDNRSNNYLVYIVCPDFEKLKRFGGGDFYELRALGPFVQRAGEVAATFVRELTGAYAHPQSRPPDGVELSNLARFWNLDTGLGLQVRKADSHLRKEVITQLDFVHVLELGAGSGPIGFERCRDGEGYLEVEGAEFEFPQGQRAFQTYRAQPFDGIGAIEEGEQELLEWIPLAKPQANGMKATPIDRIFDEGGASPAPVCEVATMKVTRSDAQGAAQSALKAGAGEAQVVCQEIFDRLNLWLRVPIPSLGLRGQEQLGMFLWADKKSGLDGAAKELPEPTGSSTGLRTEPVTTKEWFAAVRKAKGLLDYRDVPDEDEVAARYGLKAFSTRILANLLPSEELDAKRKLGPGEWNGVVPFKPHKDHYGRNFVVGTGRSLVLRPTDSGNFAGRADFGKWTNVFPTEQVFFTLFPLVRTEKGVFDVFSKKQVQKDQLEGLTRIDATGFVKIVLFFEIGRDGSAQVNECYVDGLRVPVV